MQYMFLRARSFTGTGLQNWNVGKVGNLFGMFWLATSFREDISGWEIGSATQMIYMLNSASMFNYDMCYWGDKTSSSLAGS